MNGARSSVDRVLASEARSRWFDPSRAHHLCAAIGVVLGLSGCAGIPADSTLALRSDLSSSLSDGPPLGPAPDPMKTPDAEPQVETISTGGANKPYQVAGRTYTPITTDAPLEERGMASWYGRKFHGRRTSSGEPYNMFAMSAAHTTMPLPSYAKVRNPANGREIIVKVNDRGPFASDRIMDLSWAAASKLGIAGRVSMVEVQRLTNADILARNPNAYPDDSAVATSGSRGGNAPVVVVSTAPGGVSANPAPATTTPPTTTPAPRATTVTTVVTVPAHTPAPVPPSSRPPAAAANPVATAAAAPGFWLQLGAFSKPEGAQSMQRDVASSLDWISPVLKVFSDGTLHRLQAGPYRSREEANEVAGRVRSGSSWTPMVVERR
jgi:rare lipoprotein A